MILGDCSGNDVAVRRRDQPHIDTQFLVSLLQRVERPIFQKPQQFRLQRTAHVANFIQKNRPSVRLFHSRLPNFWASDCPCKRPLLVPEQFALQQIFRNRRAVYPDIIRHVPETHTVQRARNQFLPRVLVSPKGKNQDRRVRGSNDFDLLL